jgi:hypothetical protein
MGSQNRLRALISGLALLCSLSACDSEEGGGTVGPGTDCVSIEDWQSRLDCAYSLAEQHLDDPEALASELQTLDDAEDQDMILYRLAFNHPTEAPRLCKQVKTRAFTEKCKQVMGRPHLGTSRKAKAAPPEHRGQP